VEKSFPSKWTPSTAVLIFISDKVDFKLKSIRRDNEGHFILMKITIHQEEIPILTIYAPNTEAPIYIKNSPESTDRH
jgi:hypothetical protein